LKNAFDSLQKLLDDSRTPFYQDELQELEETYKQLLHYYIAGSKDPMQTKIYNETLASAYQLSDKIVQKRQSADAPDLYYSIQRAHHLHPENIARLSDSICSAYELENIPAAETSLASLFKLIWTTLFLSEDDTKSLRDILTLKGEKTGGVAANRMTILNCQIVSALFLGLQSFFDKRKLCLLIDAAENADEEVQIRAYTGILITLYLYQDRMDCYPDLTHRLAHLAEKPAFKKIVYLLIIRFILSRETEKISSKLKNEIIPEMMKLHPKFNPRTSFKDFSAEYIENEMNPEWLDKFADTSLGKKIEEFNKLQEEGADVMHSTFIHLKSFPFFHEISNWFMPFNSGYSSLSDEDALIKSLEIITSIGFMCNSDLFSFYFSIQQIPEASRRMMIGQLESQMMEVKKQKSAELQTRDNHTERIIGQYIQDLYRFFKLYPRRGEFFDIFTKKLDFQNLSILQPYFSDKEDLLNIAEYYLHKNYFEDALTLYERLLDTSEGDETLFQKMGYCRQMTGDHEGALREYTRAEFINPDSKWLLRRMAQCCRALKKPEKAIRYYLHYERLDPNDLSVSLNIGSCYLEMKNYPEALKYYFKVDYLDPNSGKALRPIAWCSFLTGKLNQAQDYYTKIIRRNPDYPDFMNAGHTEWVLQNIQGALHFYRQSINATGKDFQKFKAAFLNDQPELIAAGIDPKELPLMLDQIQFESKKWDMEDPA
jgi:tetratricopeptide (TPR) repeat protein